MTTPPTTNKELQASFDTATEKNIPHYFVDLPKWEDPTTLPMLKDTVSDEPVFKDPTPLNCFIDLDPDIKKLQSVYPQLGHVKSERTAETQPNTENGNKLEKVPHPFSHTNHIDPNVTRNDKDKLGEKIRILKTDLERLGDLDGELHNVLKDVLPTFERAEALLPVDPNGMQRLKLNFEWMLCKITTLFGQINLALDRKTGKHDQMEYNNARESYIALMQDLDNHEPLPRNAVPGKLGYGRNLKWVYFYPLIHKGRIKGVKVVAKWNPHVSSSGVPIAH